MRKFKTLKDINLLVLMSEKNDIWMNLGAMYGTTAIDLFKDLHFIHLIYINGRYGKKIKMDITLKRHLSAETGISLRTIHNWVKIAVERGDMIKQDGYYRFSGTFNKVFKKHEQEITKAIGT